jgi:hypothetical protein
MVSYHIESGGILETMPDKAATIRTTTKGKRRLEKSEKEEKERLEPCARRIYVIVRVYADFVCGQRAD